MLMSLLARTNRLNEVVVRLAPAIAAIDVAAHNAAISTTSAAERHRVRTWVRAQSSAADIVRTSVAGRLPAVVDDAPVAHPHDSLRGVSNRLIVCHQEDRLASRVQSREELEHFLAALGI